MKVQAAVRNETKKIALGVCFFAAVMLIIFLVLGSFNYSVLLGAVLGCCAAVGNFFLMALTVQQAAEQMHGMELPPEENAQEDLEEENQDEKKPLLSNQARLAKRKVQKSYYSRMLLLCGVAILAVTLPCFDPIASLLPLIFPRFVILLDSFLHRGKDA